MTKAEMITDLKQRAAKERRVAKQFREWLALRVAGGFKQSDTWASECEAEARFFDAVAEALSAT